MCETSGHMTRLKSIRDRVDDVNDAVVFDTAVQAMALLERIRASAALREAVERELGEDVWPV